MKAMVATAYGSPDVFRLAEVETPTPRDNQIRVRVHATTVSAGDCEVRRFQVPGFIWLPLRLYLGVRKPRKGILGQELAGEVDAVGTDVTRFKPGDLVFASTGLALGAYAEYTCLPETGVVAIKPAGIGFGEAATVPLGGLNALDFLRRAQVQRGEQVLVNGAGGSIGTYAVQLAKRLGAEVTAVDSAAKLDMLRSIGADRVVDYTRESFADHVDSYDVIFDVVGTRSLARSIRALRKGGRYLLANPKLPQVIRGQWISARSDRRVISTVTTDRVADLDFLAGLIEAGEIAPVIDRRYPLHQMVEAHRYVEAGHKQGCVVIDVAPSA